MSIPSPCAVKRKMLSKCHGVAETWWGCSATSYWVSRAPYEGSTAADTMVTVDLIHASCTTNHHHKSRPSLTCSTSVNLKSCCLRPGLWLSLWSQFGIASKVSNINTYFLKENMRQKPEQLINETNQCPPVRSCASAPDPLETNGQVSCRHLRAGCKASELVWEFHGFSGGF